VLPTCIDTNGSASEVILAARLATSQRRPHALPTYLDVLDGPAYDVVELPHRLGWTGRQQYDVDPADLAVLYERVLTQCHVA